MPKPVITEKEIILDGIKNGFMVLRPSNKQFIYGNKYFDPETKKFTENPHQPMLFTNQWSAVAMAAKYQWSPAAYDYKLYMMIDDMIVDYTDIQQYLDHFEYIQNGVCYKIRSIENDKLIYAGYYVFNDNQPAKNFKVSKENFRIVQNLCDGYQRDPFNNPFCIIKSMCDPNGFYTMDIKFTTIKIHIGYNTNLIDINAQRKEKGIRAIPFIKDMDKYNTLYVFATKDINDYAGSLEDAKQLSRNLINYIAVDLKNTFEKAGIEPKPYFVPLEFNGTVITNQEVLPHDKVHFAWER